MKNGANTHPPTCNPTLTEHHYKNMVSGIRVMESFIQSGLANNSRHEGEMNGHTVSYSMNWSELLNNKNILAATGVHSNATSLPTSGENHPQIAISTCQLGVSSLFPMRHQINMPQSKTV